MENEIKEFIERHKKLRPKLERKIITILDKSKIKYSIVESRTKKSESIIDKIARKKIDNYQIEIQDIIGIRIVLFYNDDIIDVEKLIINNFTIDTLNSTDKESLYSSNEFGYLSRHYIIMINGFYAEIQVRTILQHAWASISHELSYKKTTEVPKELSRKLFRLASLLELADDEFKGVRDQHFLISEKIDQLSDNILAKEEINVLTLKRNITTPFKIYDRLTLFAIKAGFGDGGLTATNKDKDSHQVLYGIKLVCDLLDLNFIWEFEEKINLKVREVQMLYISIMKKARVWTMDQYFFTLIAIMYHLSEKQLNIFSNQFNWKGRVWEQVFDSIKEIKERRSL